MIAYFVIDTFLVEQPAIEEAPEVTLKPRPKPKKKLPKKDSVEQPSVDKKVTEPLTESIAEEAKEKGIDDGADVPAIDEQPISEQVAEPSVDMNEESASDNSNPINDTASAISENNQDVLFEDAPVQDSTEQMLKDLEDKIKQTPAKKVDSYSPAPNYENTGRGLVYNCQGLHWACVDGPSYRQCENNYGYQKNNEKSIECYPDMVFSSIRDCSIIQQQKIVDNTKTEFCN